MDSPSLHTYTCSYQNEEHYKGGHARVHVEAERERKREEAESICNNCHQEGARIVGPSEQSGTIEGDVGVLNTSQSADPEDRHMEMLEKEVKLVAPANLKLHGCILFD